MKTSLKKLRGLCAQMAYGLNTTSNGIDFVFDKHVEGSVKDSECSSLDSNYICEQDGLLRPVRDQILLPEDFPMPYTCTPCATKHCSCGKHGIWCCPYCQCQASGKGCKNVGWIIMQNRFNQISRWFECQLHFL